MAEENTTTGTTHNNSEEWIHSLFEVRESSRISKSPPVRIGLGAKTQTALSAPVSVAVSAVCIECTSVYRL
jgi:predicted sugar kinase